MSNPTEQPDPGEELEIEVEAIAGPIVRKPPLLAPEEEAMDLAAMQTDDGHATFEAFFDECPGEDE